MSNTIKENPRANSASKIQILSGQYDLNSHADIQQTSSEEQSRRGKRSHDNQSKGMLPNSNLGLAASEIDSKPNMNNITEIDLSVQQREGARTKSFEIGRKPKVNTRMLVNSVNSAKVVDVLSKREKFYKTSYPTVIKIPSNITKVVIGGPFISSPQSQSFMTQGQTSITLTRPTSCRSGPRYTRSVTSTLYPVGETSNAKNKDPAQPMLPFLQMTNALQLHLKLALLDDDEQIILWSPGSYLLQSPLLIPREKERSFSNIFSREEQVNLTDFTKTPPQNYPAYLLLTNTNLYIARPTFRLSRLDAVLEDEQTSYIDPSKFIKFWHKISIADIKRIDVGPGRQYLVFHSLMPSETMSIVFQTRSRYLSTLIIDSITTLVHEIGIGPIINQDIEYCIKKIQDSILLKFGNKSTSIHTYDSIFPSTNHAILTCEEFDAGITEQISKVDFDFVKIYLFGVFLQYIGPVTGNDSNSVEIQHVTILGSRDYLYLLKERLDVWPPSVFPPEFDHPFESGGYKKGYLVDFIPQFTCLGVGRINEITYIHRWRSWRIDIDGYKGLGKALQNGLIGKFGCSIPCHQQQASTGGWFWWIRIHFGAMMPDGPAECISQPPSIGYFWDICFTTKESVDDFIEGVQAGGRRVKIIVGDD